MTKQRINSTGRKRIGRECIEINLVEHEIDEPMRVKISINLENQGFPNDAVVIIEAYYRSSGMWFNCGTVGEPKISDVFVLSELDSTGSVLFRLKVVDSVVEPGKLLGSAERLKLRSEDGRGERRSIFPVIFRDLKDDVWKVDIQPGDCPVLIINKRIPQFKRRLKESWVMQGLLLPSALRFVLKALVNRADACETDDEPSWIEEWLEYCREELGEESDPRDLSDENKEYWIDDIVTRFCKNQKFVERIAEEFDV